MEEFGVLLIAVDDYPEPPGALQSSANADRLAKLIVGERGGKLVDRVVATSSAEILTALKRWSRRQDDPPRSTIIYLVGHGTDDGMDHQFMLPPEGRLDDILTGTLWNVFAEDWNIRQTDPRCWTLFILDCCGANIGLINLQAQLSQRAYRYPHRLGMWPTSSSGASNSGRFVDAFARTLTEFNENNAVIPLTEVFRKMLAELGDLQPHGFLPQEAVLNNPQRLSAPLVINLDDYGELKRVIAELPSELRVHFLNKAQGTETADFDWYFEGRSAETNILCSWLRDAPSGMRVVTGAPGSGKSALLGHISVLANDRLVEAYAATNLAPELRNGPRPPSNVFDASIHLTGKTVADVLDSIYRQVGQPRDAQDTAVSIDQPFIPRELWSGSLNDLVRHLEGQHRRITLLADALDEAQEPEPIARLLAALARSGFTRVLVGTRKSLEEGLDKPFNPDANGLIEALEAGPDEIIAIDSDSDATRRYVLHRLGAKRSPYVNQAQTVDTLASKIAARDQPFLFARLATSELLARTALPLDDPELMGMLDGGHAGIFETAVRRIEASEPNAAAMLRALAFGRGRGFPETGGTWVAVARALTKDVPLPDNAVRRAIEIAAPYITLDAEAGQSTYRLAHQTFVEHYRQIYADSVSIESDIAAALLKLVEGSGGWAVANYYCVRYLPAHLEHGMNADGLDRLTTDPGWLRRAINLLGVDRTINAIAGDDLPISAVATAVQKALRRSRVALSWDSSELAGQMQARLRDDKQPRLAELGTALAAESPTPTLLMTRGYLDYIADLETTYGLVGKVRALAFGQLEDHVLLLAIGVETQIYLWNPLKGADDVRIIANDDRRINALAFGEVDGRQVLVVASWYDGQVAVIRDASSGEQTGPDLRLSAYVDSVAVGLLGGRPAIVASGHGAVEAWDYRTLASIQLPPLLHPVRAVFEHEGRVVACVAATVDSVTIAWCADVATGRSIWPTPMPLDGELGVVAAGYNAREGLILAGSVDRKSVVVWSPKEPRELYRIPGLFIDTDIRGLAVADVDSLFKQTVVAVAPDYDQTTLVQLCQVEDVHPMREFDDVGRWHGPEIRSVFVSPTGAVLALTDRPLRVWNLDPGDHGDPLDLDQSTIAFALTGRHDSRTAFLSSDGKALWQPPRPEALTETLDVRTAKPKDWPRTALAWGQLDDTGIVAIGSLEGAVWIWKVNSTRPRPGPLGGSAAMKLKRTISLIRKKGGAGPVESLAIGFYPGSGDVVAVVSDGRIKIFSLADGRELPNPATDAKVVTAVALGRLRGEDVMVTGSKGGILAVWALGSGKRIAGLTLDNGIDRVWVVRGTDSIAVLARSKIYTVDLFQADPFSTRPAAASTAV
ncbi:caspase family protein [Bradyrhizobium sp. CCGUVB4N]|uniref:caspase family protein n=1 Tax=Bradyrhizobium sp. CCGUVB4N TaxID=2949631 RepID=UPI0020B1D959|nr:caspase family protein [Bradyrhizobium sp. CCGUVB4N]MCP3381239.1 caspase family protein [Bradyrhizobium sp. CCGUVB4N]